MYGNVAAMASGGTMRSTSPARSASEECSLTEREAQHGVGKTEGHGE
jgi:hypothetical protein